MLRSVARQIAHAVVHVADLGANALVALGGCGNSLRKGICRRRERTRDVGDARAAVLRDVADLRRLVACLPEQRARLRDKRLRRVDELGIHAQHRRRTRHLPRHAVHMVGKRPHRAGEIGVLGVLRKRRDDGERHIGKRFQEHLIHLVRHLIGTLVGDLRRDGILLLVGVVDDVRVLDLVGIERHHVAAEALGNHHGGVVAPGLRAVDRVFFGRERPVELVVRSKCAHHLVADVDLKRNKVTLVALVGVRHGDGEVAGVAERVPARNDVVPREDRGQEHEPDHDDHRNRIVEQVLHVGFEDAPDIPHLSHLPILIRLRSRRGRRR